MYLTHVDICCICFTFSGNRKNPSLLLSTISFVVNSVTSPLYVLIISLSFSSITDSFPLKALIRIKQQLFSCPMRYSNVHLLPYNLLIGVAYCSPYIENVIVRSTIITIIFFILLFVNKFYIIRTDMCIETITQKSAGLLPYIRILRSSTT